ncbi:MAG TPA: Nramp family divalent metal transporter [Bryobacteraceae bacterium]|nr:Nramp family divalent metal transporter [Bryobacteraceae bacterium]
MGSKSPIAAASLPEVHASVATARATLFRRLLAFAGPAYLVSVGYMDPGNWAGDLEAGSRFGYQLLWVIVLSNLMAILLQTLAARLGIVAGRDLAQASREAYPRPVCNALWVLCEIAIAACDLAEVLGAAIALHLLFGLPLVAGVLLTAADTIIVLWFSRYGIRLIEGVILCLIAIVAGCFLVELVYARPLVREIFSGIVPRIDNHTLYAAVVILGATVMPHNLYLHSALVQTRRIGTTVADRMRACRFNFIDSFMALNFALIVNAAILVLAAAVFFKQHIVVTEIEQAQSMMAPLLGTTAASVLFSIALLASGQSSTLTGTLAGQIVMEGFLDIRMRPWLRRLATRTLAIIPAVIVVTVSGSQGTFVLLLLSQVIISMQLPFAVIPLIRFTSDRSRMGEFANRGWVKALAWTTAAIILGLNFWLIGSATGAWISAAAWHVAIVAPLILAMLALLGWVTFSKRALRPEPPRRPVAADLPAPRYRTILVPLDHSDRDRVAIAHAAAMARSHGATLHLIHVEEGVTSQLYGALSSTAEVHAGEEYFESIVRSLETEGIRADLTIAHGRSPKDEIVRLAREIRADLIVMGAHGHRGLKDWIFGNTINAVRHEVSAPVLAVGDPPADA